VNKPDIDARFIDSVALCCARQVMELKEPIGGDVQKLAQVQNIIIEACKTVLRGRTFEGGK
jgi:hypothetical protein